MWFVNHPQENLVKFGYRLDNKIEKTKYLVIVDMLSFDVTQNERTLSFQTSSLDFRVEI